MKNQSVISNNIVVDVTNFVMLIFFCVFLCCCCVPFIVFELPSTGVMTELNQIMCGFYVFSLFYIQSLYTSAVDAIKTIAIAFMLTQKNKTTPLDR